MIDIPKGVFINQHNKKKKQQNFLYILVRVALKKKKKSYVNYYQYNVLIMYCFCALDQPNKEVLDSWFTLKIFCLIVVSKTSFIF